jgi:hypothetical protein
MIEGIAKRKPKKDICHSTIVLFSEVVSIRSRITGEEKIGIIASRRQKKKNSLRERFIKNKRPLNPTHIFPNKEKRLETRTTKRAIMMS